jgi:hypothetical protein
VNGVAEGKWDRILTGWHVLDHLKAGETY